MSDSTEIRLSPRARRMINSYLRRIIDAMDPPDRFRPEPDTADAVSRIAARRGKLALLVLGVTIALVLSFGVAARLSGLHGLFVAAVAILGVGGLSGLVFAILGISSPYGKAALAVVILIALAVLFLIPTRITQTGPLGPVRSLQ